jgi:hypothetical protein
MRLRVCAVLVVSGSLAAAPAAAEGDGSPVFVIPGKRGVPVIVNGYGLDASYSVVEGDFGLSRPGSVNPVIVAGPRLPPMLPPVKHYYPGTGETPGYGRLEVQPPPNRRLPPKAESYHRSWQTSSDPLPASTDPPYPITIEPDVNVDNPWGPRRDRPRRHRRGR